MPAFGCGVARGAGDEGLLENEAGAIVWLRLLDTEVGRGHVDATGDHKQAKPAPVFLEPIENDFRFLAELQFETVFPTGGIDREGRLPAGNAAGEGVAQGRVPLGGELQGMLCVRTRVAFRIVPAAFGWPGSMSKSSRPNEANLESPRLESPWTLK